MNMLQDARNQVKAAIEAGTVITGTTPDFLGTVKPVTCTVGPYQRATGPRTYAAYWKGVEMYEGPSAYKAAVQFVSAVGRWNALAATQEGAQEP